MTGRVFAHDRFVSGADVGPDGRAHLHVIADWLQAVAFADGLDAGLGSAGAWIIRRTTLRVTRLPSFGETLTLRTWCGALAASVAERRTSLTGDGGGAVDTEAIWVHIDPEARRPARFPPEFLAVYSESADDARPRTSLRHAAAPSVEAERTNWTFTSADVDIAGHVNNAVYWRLAEDLLPGARDPATGTVLEAEYRGGVGAGTVEVATDESAGMIWVIAGDGSVAGSLSASVA